MKAPTLGLLRIRSIRRHLLARRFAVPKLQRNFVWNGGRSAKLLDSMYRDMPIGSLFLWEMDRKSANLVRQSAELLPSFNNANKHIWFVIDGQQRLSVIHQAFEAQVRLNNAGRMPSQAVGFLRKIKDCRQRLLNYPMPIVTVRSATLDEIGEVFIRVNSQGMRITSADRAIALMGKLDVRAMAQELRQKIRDEVFALGGIDPILMGFNLITERPQADGGPPKLEAMARRWSRQIADNEDEKDQFRKLWHKYQNAFLSGVDYLHHRFPVHDQSYLPSANMLATLAVSFYHHPGQPNRYQAGEIRKWFWTTGVAQRYSGRGYHRNIVADAKLFESLARGVKRRFVFRDRLDPILDIEGAEYVSRSARTRAFFCLLASRKPRYLENGELIFLGQSVISHSNRKHRHHVFPQAQLSSHFSSRVCNSLCNICFLVSRDNQKIGMRLPRSYLAEYREAGREQFRRVMRSHLVPVGDDSGVWDRGVIRAFKQFRRRRLGLICAEFEKEAGIKLFRKS